jgi:hypothetical protein
MNPTTELIAKEKRTIPYYCNKWLLGWLVLPSYFNEFPIIQKVKITNELLIIFLSLPLIFVGCKPDKDAKPLISEYYYGYMDYDPSCAPNPEGNGIVEIKYSGSKIIKREGGLIQTNPMTGYDYKFIKGVYDEITYSDNLALIKNRVASGNDTLFIADREILFDSQGRILRKIQPNKKYYWNIDTLNYYYHSNGLLDKVQNIQGYIIETSTFHFNNSNNLDSIVTITSGEEELISQTKEYFGDFDNAPNPIKSIMMFNETFNRSLSQNNYGYYSLKKYDSNDSLIEQLEKTFTLYYDDSGNPLFNKY